MSHTFLQSVSFQGGRTGGGQLSLDGQSIAFSLPSQLQGPGTGTNPEELLQAAVGACFSLTLSLITAKSQPDIARVAVEVEGIVEEVTEPKRGLKYKELRLTPHIHMKPGAATPDAAALKAACKKAEAACFITQTVKPGVGAVVLKDHVLHAG